LTQVARVLPGGQARLTNEDSTVDNEFGGMDIESRQIIIEFRWRQFANTSSPDATDEDDIQTAQFRVSI